MCPRRGCRLTMKLKVKGTEYGTVAQYIYGLQADLFMAVAAGVVIHQHTPG